MTHDTTGGTATTQSTTLGTRSTGAATVEFPIDDPTYNLLQALTSKLESIDAYRTYMQEDASSGQIFRQLAEEDSKHAKQLLEQLRQRLNSGSR